MLGLVIWCVHIEAMVAIGMLVFYSSLSSATRRQMGFRPAILALAIPPIAFILPKLLLLNIVYFFIVPVFATRRNLIVPIYVLALMALPDFKTPLAVGPVYLFYGSIYDSLGFGALLTMLMRFPLRGRLHFAADIPMLLVISILMFGRVRDSSVTNIMRIGVEMLLTYGLPYYIASRGVRSIDDLKRVMLYMTGAAVMVSVVMCYETLRTWPLYRILYPHYGVDLTEMVKLRSGRLRATGTAIESTSMAFIMVPCFLAALCSRRAFVSKSHYIAILCLLTFGLILPQSRGALVGLLFAITMMSLYLRRHVVVGGVVFIGLCLATTMMIVPPESRLGNMLGRSAETTTTSDYRRDLLRRGLQEIRKRPLIGTSEGGVMANLKDMQQGEGIVDFVNMYLYVTLISGLIGLVVFIAGLLGQPLALWKVRRALPSGGPDIKIFAFVFAGLLAPVEMIAFTSLGGRPTSFLMMFIAFAAAIVADRRQSVRAGRLSHLVGSRTDEVRSPASRPSDMSMPAAGEWREPFPQGMARRS